MKDFFVSYNSADRHWAEWIAWHLEESGYTTVIQAWDSRPGKNFVLWMQESASQANRTIAVLSQAYLDAAFTQPEWTAAFRQDPTGEKGTLLPVRVETCDLKGLLPAITYIDLVDLDENVAKEALLEGVKLERVKPSSPPGFPGLAGRLAARPEFPGFLAKPNAIKGLRPFGFEDAELFLRLQRETTLRECLDVLTDRDFRLGVLSAESGCGKTSFLQAGVWPMMNSQSASHYCVYIKFTDLDPLATISSALIEQTKLDMDNSAGRDFLRLLREAAQAEGKHLILLFDQFEQFFVHLQREEQRQPFIAALTEWYQQSSPPPVSILFSLRRDFIYGLIEIQRALGYHLSPQNLFELHKFTPAQATEIFQVMAETADLPFDRDFVKKMTEQELAGKEDGLISPVDVQILAWMIQGHQSDVRGGFNETVYQRMGGIEGLLENFLSHVMKVFLAQEKQLSLKVLLSLVDLEGNVRAGLLTLQQMQEKLADQTRERDLERTVARLAESRLITPGKRNGTLGYELAHERLIPALRRLAGKELSEVERANQLLERRVNEWLGNERSRRYLFSIRELWTLKKQKPYLQWGKRRHQKEELLKRSRRWRALRSGVALLLALLVVGVPIGLVQMLSPSFLLEEDAQAMIVENGYYDGNYNPDGTGIQHQYEVRTVKGDQIVVDQTTGRTWQQSGSSYFMRFQQTQAYVDTLNAQKFSGYADWRLPTLEEAMSLMAPKMQSHGLYIDPVFDITQRWIWTADKESASRAWYVHFYSGHCYYGDVDVSYGYVRAVR